MNAINHILSLPITDSTAQAYQATTDKAVFIADLLGLFSVDQLTPELEDMVESEILKVNQ